MSHTQKVKIAGLLLLAIMTIGMFALTPLGAFWLHLGGSNAKAASPLPYHEFANGPYTVKGNTIVGADGKQYLFHGVGRDSLEFDCSGDGFLDAAHLAFMGPGTSGPNGTYWYANTVRLPVSEGFWLHGYAGQTNCTPANYQAIVKNTINAITAMKLNVILDLMWTDAGGQVTGSGAGYEMPDSDSQLFWSQAAKVYASYSNVLFELYNEPHPPTFACWAAPTCTITNDTTSGGNVSYTGVSIQSLVNAVRGAGANNLALVAGINWGFDLSQLNTYPITGSNVVYDSHPYPYSGKNTTAEWDAAFGYLTATKPVMSAEFGEYDGNSSFESMAVNYFDQHMMGWTAWSWYNTGGTLASKTGYPQLVSDYIGTPLANMGTYIYQQLLNYAGVTGGGTPSPTPTLPPVTGPVSKVWYFAEGRVGAGFSEFLTLGNPTGNTCQVNLTYLTQPDSGTGGTKTFSFSVPASTRVTRWVDSDLGTSTTGHGISDAATISVDSTTTPNCSGIVAERPMYFTALGTKSGSDVVGVTHTSTTFYFAD
ncbi:MAG: glycoside hydrolase family 5 protein, partial [Ktedonobacteraceae bacterium]